MRQVERYGMIEFRVCAVASDRGSVQPAGYYLYYYGANRPGKRDYSLPASANLRCGKQKHSYLCPLIE